MLLTPSRPPRRRQAEHKVEYDQSVSAENGCSMKYSGPGSSLSTDKIRGNDGAGVGGAAGAVSVSTSQPPV